jgi:hypothetical protein
MRDFGLASEYHVLAIADFLPPIAFSLLPRPVTGGSMAWMLELITDQLGGLSLEGWRLDAELVAGRDGSPLTDLNAAVEAIDELLGRHNWRLTFAQCFHYLWTQAQMRLDELRRSQSHPLI